MNKLYDYFFNKEKKKEFVLKEQNETSYLSEKVGKQTHKTKVFKELSANLSFMEKCYNKGINSDFVVRNFVTHINGKPVKGFAAFFDGMASSVQVNESIIKPLQRENANISVGESIEDVLELKILQQCHIKRLAEFEGIINEVNYGNCAVFADGAECAITADVKEFARRSVGKPDTENIIRGPKEAFSESLRANTSMIRKTVRDENIIIEGLEAGNRSHNSVAVVYIKDIASEKLVSEVKRRIKSINVDYLTESGQLEQMIEDKGRSIFPKIMATERPDKVCLAICEGKVAVLLHGSPYALIMPVVAFDFIKSPEDKFVKFPFNEIFRIIRYLALFIALFLPAIYIATVNFHQSIIPADFIFAIEATREKVPFPSVLELLLMELVFEMLREAGIRVPEPIGSTLGIVGGLILGQAAVSANLVSPLLLVVVSLTGLASFGVPDYTLSYTVRILKYIFILAATAQGFLGITAAVFASAGAVCSSKSFGVPFLSPLAPKTRGGLFSSILTMPAAKNEKRADYLNPQKIKKAAKISRGWQKNERN